MKMLYSVSCVLLLLFTLPLSAQESVETRVITTGLDTPWEILWGPDDWIWMTERGGRVSRVNPANGQRVDVATIPGVVDGQQSGGEFGLLGMAVNEEAGIIRVYLVYSSSQTQDQRVVRYNYDGTTLVDPLPLITGLGTNVNHNGSRLLIVGDKLFVTCGDAEDPDIAQDLGSMNGKILRVNLDGSVPDDNPWADQPHPTNLIWTSGHRNPQGLVYAPNGILYSSEHGPNNDDELNMIERGRNYGWPNVEGLCDQPGESQFCADFNVFEPTVAWTPTLAVAGLDYYGSRAIEGWKNSLLLVTLKERDLRRLALSADGRSIVDETTYYDGSWGRLRDLCVAPDGRVFLATSNRDGRGNPQQDDDRIIELRSSSLLPLINTPEFADSVACTENPIAVRFTTTGEFTPGNVFIAQVFDENGLPTIHGIAESLVGTSGGEVMANLRGPRSFRVRIIATEPPDTSEMSAPIRVRLSPVSTINPSSGILCGDNDSLTLTATLIKGEAGVSTFVWFTGDTGTTLVVREPGSYGGTVIDSNGCYYVGALVNVTAGNLPQVVLAAERLTICEGDSLLLEASGFGASRYQWSTGETTRTITVREGGAYWVEGISAEGCVQRTEEVQVVVAPFPAKPNIARQGDTLITSPADAYQWYKDGIPLLNGRGQRYITTTDGIYTVGAKNAAGCETLSDPVEVRSSGVDLSEYGDGAQGIAVHPHPFRDRLRIDFGGAIYGPYTITLADIRGARVFTFSGAGEGESHRELSLTSLPAGAYVLQVETEAGRRVRTVVKR